MDRRRALQRLAGGAGLVLVAPRLALAAADTRRRFVFVIQRGAADGLETIVPHGDPGYARLRGALALDPAALLARDGLFGLHPALEHVARLYRDGQALFVHAVASPYRDRSHFDGQNVLESGGRAPYRLKDGWLNRLVAALPRGAGAPRAADAAIALAPAVPLALRGPAPVASYSPTTLPEAGDDLLDRVTRLYEHDAGLHALWSAALDARRLAAAAATGDGPDGPAGSAGPPGMVHVGPARQARPARDAGSLGRLAARFLARPDGPRIAMLETGGWDTHSGQNGRLTARLRELDALIAGLQQGLGAAWAQTVVVVATEFGRTAAANGTGGTDHGTAAVAWLVGGAVRGGRLLGDWPGLGPADLHEGRDLRPTGSLDGLLARAAGECFGLAPDRLARTLFPPGEPTAGRGRDGGDARLPTLLRG